VLKVQSIGGVAQYLVHYQGWNKKFDEWVTDDRVMEATAENIKVAQEMRAKADAEEAARKKQPGGKKKATAGGADASAAAGASASTLSGQKRKGVDVVKETVS
jgi:mortality factor 4-like protein 1